MFFSLLPHSHFEVKISNPTNKISVALGAGHFGGKTSARGKIRPSPQFLIIPPASFADNPFTYVHEVAFEMI
jgi:hypothetical protein